MKHYFKTLITNKSTIVTREFEFDDHTSFETLEEYLEEIDGNISKETSSIAFICFRGLDTVCALHFIITPPIVEWFTVSFMIEKLARDLFFSL